MAIDVERGKARIKGWTYTEELYGINGNMKKCLGKIFPFKRRYSTSKQRHYYKIETYMWDGRDITIIHPDIMEDKIIPPKPVHFDIKFLDI